MGFYNIGYILRNILYNFRKSLKYIVLILLIILIFYVLLSPKVKAVSDVPSVVYSSVDSFFEESGYTDFLLALEDNNYRLLIFNQPANSSVYVSDRSDTQWWVRQSDSSVTYPVKIYTVSSSGVITFDGDRNFGQGPGRTSVDKDSFFYGTQNVYSSNSLTDLVFEANYNTFENPFLYNENGYSYLQTNSFNSFVIFPGDTSVVDFVLQNTTDNWSFLNAPQIKITLDIYSSYWTNTSQGHCWVVPKSVLNNNIFKQVNGQSYRLRLMNLDHVYNEYQWTFDMLDDTVASTEQQTQEEINQGISDINSFLNNDSVNSNDITSNMPSTNVQNPTENAFNNIFTSFRNAFINDNPPDFVFEVPFSNGQTITIPANYISSKVPTVIIVLIQGFYWFIICRYIVKDISATVENAKSGKILDTKDGNIKTELL